MKTRCPDILNTRSARPGFTLIELLASLFLIGLIMPTAMRGVSLVTRLASEARHQRQAVTLARTKLEELIATGDWQTGGLRQGNFGDEFPAYRWSWELLSWETSPMEELTVYVTWTPERSTLWNDVRAVSLSTLVEPDAS